MAQGLLSKIRNAWGKIPFPPERIKNTPSFAVKDLSPLGGVFFAVAKPARLS